MKREILSIVFLVALGHISAQERPSFTDIRCDNFTTDIQNNLYLWKDATLSLYTNTGEHIADYSDPKAGPIASTSANTGTKILVFHQESGTINLLNNKLAVIDNPIHLFEKGLFTITEAALLGTSQIVLYDASNEDLIILNLNLTTSSKTHCDFGKEFSPQLLRISSEKEILLIDSASGIYFFDSFGTFEKKISIIGIKDAHLYQGILYYLKGDLLYGYRLENKEQFEIPLEPLSSIKAFSTSQSHQFFLDKSGKIHHRIITHEQNEYN